MSQVFKTHVQFLFPDEKLIEKEVASRDSQELVIPDGAIGFRFFDRCYTPDGGLPFEGPRINFSDTFYLRSYLKTTRKKYVEYGYRKTVLLPNGPFVQEVSKLSSFPPKGCSWFRMFDVDEATTPDGIKLTSARLNVLMYVLQPKCSTTT